MLILHLQCFENPVQHIQHFLVFGLESVQVCFSWVSPGVWSIADWIAFTFRLPEHEITRVLPHKMCGRAYHLICYTLHTHTHTQTTAIHTLIPNTTLYSGCISIYITLTAGEADTGIILLAGHTLTYTNSPSLNLQNSHSILPWVNLSSWSAFKGD